MENINNLSEYNKENHPCFDFFINKLPEENTKTYLDDFLGMAKLPLIGHYNGNDYSLGSVLSLVCFQIKVCQGENNDKIISDYNDFTLPNNLSEYLNIYEELTIKNNTKSKLSPKFYPKKKLNFYFIISGLPFYTTNNKKDNIELDFKILNIVPHLYYNKNNEIDFSKTKRLVFEKGICLFEVEGEKNDISHFKNDKLDISINDLRIEYTSLHLKKGALAFSPNNLKFKLGTNNPLSHFYVIINNNDNDYHSVFYYITCNNDQSETCMKNLLKKSKTINDIIENIKKEFPNSQNISNNLEIIFHNNK